MGKICPECGERSAVIGVITVDGRGARKAEDVLAYKLACGHTVGGEEYTAFVAECHKIDVEAQKAIQDAYKQANSLKASVWKSMSKPDKEDEDHAE